MYKLVEGAERTSMRVKKKSSLGWRVRKVDYCPEFYVIVFDDEGGVITIEAQESLPTKLVDKLSKSFRQLYFQLDGEIDSVALLLSREFFRETKKIVICPQEDDSYKIIIAP